MWDKQNLQQCLPIHHTPKLFDLIFFILHWSFDVVSVSLMLSCLSICRFKSKLYLLNLQLRCRLTNFEKPREVPNCSLVHGMTGEAFFLTVSAPHPLYKNFWISQFMFNGISLKGSLNIDIFIFYSLSYLVWLYFLLQINVIGILFPISSLTIDLQQKALYFNFLSCL